MKIKVIAFDVDGTLTDGGIYVGENGEMMKRFNVRDGYGLHTILPQYDITPVIITGRKSEIVKKRAEELGIDHIYQGVSNKLEKLLEICASMSITMEEVAYIGDDLNDLECLNSVGLSACPCDSEPKLFKTVDYVCKHSGGNGAVREFINYITSKID